MNVSSIMSVDDIIPDMIESHHIDVPREAFHNQAPFLRTLGSEEGSSETTHPGIPLPAELKR